jgi:hypothetical protein
MWCLLLLVLENKGNGLAKEDLLDLLSRNESELQVPSELRRVYGDFGYRYTLGRSLGEVIDVLLKNQWAEATPDGRYAITPAGVNRLRQSVKEARAKHLSVGAYGRLSKAELLRLPDGRE